MSRFEGKHYFFRGGDDAWQRQFGPAVFLPAPVQRPRIPIWVGGTWPHKAPFCRAARWDGMVPMCDGQALGEGISPEALSKAVAFVPIGAEGPNGSMSLLQVTRVETTRAQINSEWFPSQKQAPHGGLKT